MEFLVISGLSGAGKSQAADILEDLDFYCVDNMPTALLPKFAELCLAMRSRYERVALVTDIRTDENFDELFAALDSLIELGCDTHILYMEASVDAIVKRYKQTRRRHPLAPNGGSIQAAVEKEVALLAPIRARADYLIDTTGLTSGMLKGEIGRIFSANDLTQGMAITVMSFGFKYGVPIEADLVFDVRFLPNPFYVDELRPLNGLDQGVSDFVFHGQTGKEFMEHLTGMLAFLLPQYVEEGKNTLTICIGCTGGRHRSVAVAAALTEFIAGTGRKVRLLHRDLEKN